MKEYLHYTTTASTPLSAYKQGINMELHKAFENWVDEQGVIDYCKKNYSFTYDTATNTLNSAVKKGWLQRDDNPSQPTLRIFLRRRRASYYRFSTVYGREKVNN